MMLNITNKIKIYKRTINKIKRVYMALMLIFHNNPFYQFISKFSKYKHFGKIEY